VWLQHTTGKESRNTKSKYYTPPTTAGRTALFCTQCMYISTHYTFTFPIFSSVMWLFILIFFLPYVVICLPPFFFGSVFRISLYFLHSYFLWTLHSLPLVLFVLSETFVFCIIIFITNFVCNLACVQSEWRLSDVNSEPAALQVIHSHGFKEKVKLQTCYLCSCFSAERRGLVAGTTASCSEGPEFKSLLGDQVTLSGLFICSLSTHISRC
jgi:hypothetical protein